MLDQIVDPGHPLQDISKRYCKDIAHSMRAQGFHHGHGIMVVFFSPRS